MGHGQAVDDLDELLRRQHQTLSRRQALAFFEPAYVRRAVHRHNRWQTPHRDVLVLHNGPLLPEQRLWTATLAAPRGSALWGGTAAGLDGYTDRFADPSVHVVLPVGARRVRIPWVVSHWSSALTEDDVHPTALPRRTRLPRSLLDLASDARSERRARAVIFSGYQQRLVTADALADALARRGPCRHHALLTETVEDLRGGITSVPEKDFDRIVRRLGLPRPDRQVVRQRPNGRYYLDTVWLLFRLWVEVDGGHHREAQHWEDDLDRTADVVADGLRLIRFTSHAVRHQPARVGEVLVRAMRSGGYEERAA